MLRLVLSIVLLLLSLLCFWRAPMLYLWYMAILVTEFWWVFAGVSLVLALAKWGNPAYYTAGTAISVIAMLVFLSTVVRAMLVAKTIDTDFNTSYNTTSDKSSNPYSIWRTFNGLGDKQLKPVAHTYVSYGDKDLSLDFYKAQSTGKQPLVIVIHGGSWSGGDNKQLPELNTHLANEGYHVASINYRLASHKHFPAPIEDVAAAIRYLKSKSEELNIDTNRIVLLGRSAGAQIAMIAGYTLQDPSIKGVINYYGPADMIWGYHNPANRMVFNSCKIIEYYIGGTYKQLPKKYASSSAVENVNATIPPTLSIHGITDPLCAYEHSTRLGAKLQAAGVKYYLLTLPWATHGCDYTLYGPSGQLATYTTDRFLKLVLR